MIIVDCRSGLANRMQAIDAARALAADLQRELVIPWLVNWACGASVQQIFEGARRLGDIRTFTAAAEVDAFLSRLRPSVTIDHYVEPYVDIPNAELITSLGDPRLLEPHPVVLIRSWARFYPSPNPFALFRLVPMLHERVLEIAAGFDRTVGIHIRRSDHQDAIRCSPTIAFSNIMGQLVSTAEASSFYLATDDPQVESQLRREFPIMSHPKRSFARHSIDGVQDAAIDLYALARTRRIVGSAGSTFSIVAAALGGAPLTIALAETPDRDHG